jgi:hypothetical protein
MIFMPMDGVEVKVHTFSFLSINGGSVASFAFRPLYFRGKIPRRPLIIIIEPIKSLMMADSRLNVHYFRINSELEVARWPKP